MTLTDAERTLARALAAFRAGGGSIRRVMEITRFVYGDGKDHDPHVANDGDHPLFVLPFSKNRAGEDQTARVDSIVDHVNGVPPARPESEAADQRKVVAATSDHLVNVPASEPDGDDEVSNAARIMSRRAHEVVGSSAAPSGERKRKATVRAKPGPEPSVVQLAAITASRIADAARVRTIFDRYRTSDNRLWGDVQYHELAIMALDGGRARSIKAIIDRRGTGRNDYAAIRDLMTETEFSEAIKAALHAA